MDLDKLPSPLTIKTQHPISITVDLIVCIQEDPFIYQKSPAHRTTTFSLAFLKVGDETQSKFEIHLFSTSNFYTLPLLNIIELLKVGDIIFIKDLKLCTITYNVQADSELKLVGEFTKQTIIKQFYTCRQEINPGKLYFEKVKRVESWASRQIFIGSIRLGNMPPSTSTPVSSIDH